MGSEVAVSSTLLEQYMTLGALGISFLTLIGIVAAWVKNIGPTLQGMKDALEDVKHETKDSNQMLENNTRALVTVASSVQEVANSNVNMANMVSILTNTLDTQAKLIEKHDLDSGKNVEAALLQLRNTHADIIKSVEKCSESNNRQHSDISGMLIRHDDRSQRLETEIGRVKGKVELMLTKKD